MASSHHLNSLRSKTAPSVLLLGTEVVAPRALYLPERLTKVSDLDGCLVDEPNRHLFFYVFQDLGTLTRRGILYSPSVEFES
ncbi:hypothetical protein D3C87_1474830 [compost metagenome]